MSYFDNEMIEPKKKGSRIGYFFSGVLGALIGGLLVLFLAPAIFGLLNEKEQIIIGDAEKPAISAPVETVVEPGLKFPDIADIAEKVGPAVVGITNEGRVYDFFGQSSIREQGSGSGVIIDESGYIVTNYHVIENSTQLTVSLPDGRKLEAAVVGSDATTDLAVIKIEAEDLDVAVLGNSDNLRAGELAVAIGNPLGSEFAGSVTFGVISATDRSLTIDGKQFKLLQTDAAINPGNSGGALVNSAGEVIGINSAKLIIQGVEGMGFALPISSARPIIEELIEKGYVTRPYLGIRGQAIDEVTAKRNKIPQGIYIVSLELRGPAERAGLKAGDIIVALDGQETPDFAVLSNVLNKFKPEDKVKISINRNNELLELEIALGEMPRD